MRPVASLRARAAVALGRSGAGASLGGVRSGKEDKAPCDWSSGEYIFFFFLTIILLMRGPTQDGDGGIDQHC